MRLVFVLWNINKILNSSVFLLKCLLHLGGLRGGGDIWHRETTADREKNEVSGRKRDEQNSTGQVFPAEYQWFSRDIIYREYSVRTVLIRKPVRASMIRCSLKRGRDSNSSPLIRRLVSVRDHQRLGRTLTAARFLCQFGCGACRPSSGVQGDGCGTSDRHVPDDRPSYLSAMGWKSCRRGVYRPCSTHLASPWRLSAGWWTSSCYHVVKRVVSSCLARSLSCEKHRLLKWTTFICNKCRRK